MVLNYNIVSQIQRYLLLFYLWSKWDDAKYTSHYLQGSLLRNHTALIHSLWSRISFSSIHAVVHQNNCKNKWFRPTVSCAWGVCLFYSDILKYICYCVNPLCYLRVNLSNIITKRNNVFSYLFTICSIDSAINKYLVFYKTYQNCLEKCWLLHQDVFN